MLWHLQSIEVIFSPHLQSLDRKSLHLQRLVGITKILMSGHSAMHPRCLSYVASEYWCNTNVGASANGECCCGFMTKMNVGMTFVQMKLRRGFMNVVTVSVQMKC